MPLPESAKPVQLALIEVVDAWKSMSAPRPSLTVPRVGGVVSTVTPLELAALETLPTLSLALTLTKYFVPLLRLKPEALALVAAPMLVKGRTSAAPADVPMAHW